MKIGLDMDRRWAGRLTIEVLIIVAFTTIALFILARARFTNLVITVSVVGRASRQQADAKVQ